MAEIHLTGTIASADGRISVPIAIDVTDGQGRVSIGALAPDNHTYALYLHNTEPIVLANGHTGLDANSEALVGDINSATGAQTITVSEWMAAGMHSFTSASLFDDSTEQDVATGSLAG